MSSTEVFRAQQFDFVSLTGGQEDKENASQNLLRTQVTPLWLYGIKINSRCYLSDWYLNIFCRVKMGTAPKNNSNIILSLKRDRRKSLKNIDKNLSTCSAIHLTQ